MAGDADAKRRAVLRDLGWKRFDRTQGNLHVELWRAPWSGVGREPILVSFARACFEVGI